MKSKSVSFITVVFFVTILSVGVFLWSPAIGIAAKTSAQCDAYARNYADRHSGTQGGLVGGAVNGAGRILGGITGGHVEPASNWNTVYNRAYQSCMKGK